MTSTRAVLGSIFASVAVLVVGWQVGGSVITQQAVTTTDGSTTTTTGSTATSGATVTTTPATTTGGSDGSYTGDSISTRFGSVQVQVTVSNGTIRDVTAVHLTDHDGRSVSISNRAAPILRSEALTAQSASISNVSGATYTSDAYISSLQSALDQAGL